MISEGPASPGVRLWRSVVPAGDDARVGDLSAEGRTRVRALSLYLVGTIVLALTAVGGYALVVGFDRVRPAPVEAVAVVGERELLVRYLGGVPGCGDPHRVEVAEDADEVVVSAFTVARRATREGFSCPDVGVPMLQTVRLGEALGDRDVRDGARPGVDVEVVAGVEDLLTD